MGQGDLQRLLLVFSNGPMIRRKKVFVEDGVNNTIMDNGSKGDSEVRA